LEEIAKSRVGVSAAATESSPGQGCSPANSYPYLEALRLSILHLGLTEGGFWHQRDCGVPLFSDDTVGFFSMRAWGDLMAAIWNSELATKSFSYVDFAWSTPDDLETIVKDWEAVTQHEQPQS
jgi:hypothetical protein